MQITAFTTPASAGTTSDQEPIWYIRTKEQRMLFLSLDTDAFWREAEHSDIPLSELDQVIFPYGCHEPMRDIERFIHVNQKARFYLPRKNLEKYFYSLYCKLRVYSQPTCEQRLLSRIIFMDGGFHIGNSCQIFSVPQSRSFAKNQVQNILFQSDGLTFLFVSTKAEDVDAIYYYAEKLAGKEINYMFYKNTCSSGRENQQIIAHVPSEQIS